MRILIIEDNKCKYEDLKNTLNRILENPIIDWQKSRNSGLISIMNHNYEKKGLIPYDMVICDNYMPIYDDEREIKPYGAYIITEIRKRLNLVELPIIICSSEEIEECDYNYKIKYDSSVCMDETFKTIIDDIVFYNQHQRTLDCYSCQNMSCRVENDEKPVSNCFGYIYHEKEQVRVKRLDLKNNK